MFRTIVIITCRQQHTTETTHRRAQRTEREMQERAIESPLQSERERERERPKNDLLLSGHSFHLLHIRCSYLLRCPAQPDIPPAGLHTPAVIPWCLVQYLPAIYESPLRKASVYIVYTLTWDYSRFIPLRFRCSVPSPAAAWGPCVHTPVSTRSLYLHAAFLYEGFYIRLPVEF